MAGDVSLQLPGGVEVLNPVPLDPRTRTSSLVAIKNSATLSVGFSPIYNEDDSKTYSVSGGDSVSGWTFKEVGFDEGGMKSSVYDPDGIEKDVFSMDNMKESSSKKILTSGEREKLEGIEAEAEENDMAAEIIAANEKTTPVDDDLVGIVDSENTNILKKLSWVNIKATLKTYFDTLYSTFSGSYNDLSDKPDLTVYATKDNVLERDNSNEFTPSGDYQPATKKYVDDNSGGGDGIEEAPTDGTPYSRQDAGWVAASSGGGGGHVIQENGEVVSVTPRANFNVEVANGEDNLSDDAANDATVYTPTIAGMNDINTSGRNTGDVLVSDSSNTGHTYQSTAPDRNVEQVPEANIDADGELSIFLEHGYRIVEITAKEESGNAVGTISIGSTSGGSDIVVGTAVGALSEVDLPIAKAKFSNTEDTSLFISSTAWGSGNITIYLTVIKVA